MCVRVSEHARAQTGSPASLPVNNKHVPSRQTLSRFSSSLFFLYLLLSFKSAHQPVLTHPRVLFNDKCLIGLIRQQRGWSRKEGAARACTCARMLACVRRKLHPIFQTTRCLYLKTKLKKKPKTNTNGCTLISIGRSPGLPPHPLNRTPEERPGRLDERLRSSIKDRHSGISTPTKAQGFHCKAQSYLHSPQEARLGKYP